MTTSGRSIIQSTAFSPAKANLSELVTSVVHDHALRMIERHRGRESALMLNPDDLRAVLESHPVHSVASVEAGEFIVAVPDWGVAGFGRTFEGAVYDLLEQMRSYAQDYLAKLSFYLETNRREHAPAVIRFALTAEEGQRDLVLGDSVRAGRASEGSRQLAVAGQ